MKREFATPVFMYCNQIQFETDIRTKLSAIDRTIQTDNDWIYYPVIGALESGRVTNCVERCLASEGEYYVNPYNPALFLALAAMSKGPDLYPGEYVRVGDNSKILKVIRKDEIGQYVLSDGYERDGHYFIPKEYLHRVSKEDLIKHFTGEPNPTRSEEGFNPDIGVNESGKFVNASCSQHVLIEKPTLGIIPRKIHEGNRINDIMKAIGDRLSVGQNIPETWADELNSLLYDRIERSAEA